jgi:aspartate ammonia-lyase
MLATTRIEHDLLGDLAVPDEAYYGVHTLRALTNFPITGIPISTYPNLVNALASVKEAAALANHELGLLDERKMKAIVHACRQIRSGAAHEHFVVDVIQGGAGTSTNMNANEVIANLALEHLGCRRGDYVELHPNEDVNLGQSTNDVYPTALKIATYMGIAQLVDAMGVLRASFERKADEFKDDLKMGRTQLQDAVPMTLGQEFSTFAVMLGEDEERLREASKLICEINLGATAIGTGINTSPEYAPLACRHLADVTGIPVTTSPNLVEATQDVGSFVQLSGVLKRVAVKLSKTCWLRRDQPAGGAGGLQHHAGQGQPRHSGSGEPDRVRSDRQRCDSQLRRRSRAAPVERIRTDHRAQPVQERRASSRRVPDARVEVRRRHYRESRTAALARRELDRYRHRAQPVHRLRECDAGRAGSAGVGPRRGGDRDREGPADAHAAR